VGTAHDSFSALKISATAFAHPTVENYQGVTGIGVELKARNHMNTAVT
jgi:hypothetical protein